MPTFEQLLAERAGRPILYWQIEGWGPYWSGNVAAGQRTWPYGWSTADLSATSARYLPLLARVPSTLSESIDPRNGSTAIGSMPIELLDGRTDDPTYSGVVTDLLATEVQRYGTWTLAADMTAVALTMTVTPLSGLAALQAALAASVQDVLWVGREAVRFSAVNPGTGVITLAARGYYGTTAEAHATAGDAEVRDHPHFVRDRQALLYLTLMAPDGTLGTSSRQVYGGYVSEWEAEGPTIYQLSTRSALSRLDAEIGRKQLVGQTTGASTPMYGMRTGTLEGSMLTVTLPEGPGSVANMEARGGVYCSHFLVDGKQIVEASTGIPFSHPPTVDLVILRTGVAGTDSELPDKKSTVAEVLLTDPEPEPGGLHTLVHPFLSVTAVAPLLHPLEIALAIMTSTGTKTNGERDCLPAGWGLGIPTTELATQAWEDAIADPSLACTMPGLLVGGEGKPFVAKTWIEQTICKPLGVFLYMDEDGLLSIGRLRDVYPLESLETLTDADVIPGTERLGGNQEALVGWTVYHYDLDRSDNEYKVTYRFRHARTEERYRTHGDTVEIEAEGIRGLGTPPLIVARAALIDRMFATPLPVVEVETSLHKLDLTLTQPVALTCASIVDPWLGTRGVAARACAVVGREINWPMARIKWRLAFLPLTDTGHWCPAGVVNAGDAGTGTTVTLTERTYTDGDDVLELPTEDVLGFAYGAAGVGDLVALYTADGAPRCDNVPRVTATSAAANTITLSIVFKSGGGEVTRNAGDVVTFCRYGAGATAPAEDWTAPMKTHAAWADATTGTIGATSDGPYEYGI